VYEKRICDVSDTNVQLFQYPQRIFLVFRRSDVKRRLSALTASERSLIADVSKAYFESRQSDLVREYRSASAIHGTQSAMDALAEPSSLRSEVDTGPIFDQGRPSATDLYLDLYWNAMLNEGDKE